MSTKRIVKLYEELTDRERARLAFHYLAHDDEVEVDRIVATVKRETWRVPAAGFMDYFDGCRWMAVLWSINHWIAMQRVSGAVAKALVGIALKNQDLIDEMEEQVRVWESNIVALDDALDAVCKEHDIDPGDIRRLTDAEPYSSIQPDARPDAEIFALRKKQLESALSDLQEDA